ncbi:helix-turn-helix transcriptional regulator [Streptomyces sp. F63]|uniref:helix-turn-helix transcriptional regulator n=1 Tax=Streptomyces sp. F63 TaxID=2824887 RepID=UPI001B359C6B|nr:helix-turn-helix transcriptional regulator [Streptomyces sp. F63]MBQ0985568.1 helix-turn-helix transcriptional regulator [Streptomyces sp. F63]
MPARAGARRHAVSPSPFHRGPAAARGRLLERAAQLAVLERAVREVADGGSATVLVHGRPGTGRSAVLAEAAALARRAGLRVFGAPARPAGSRGPAAAGDVPGSPLAVLADDAGDPSPPEQAASLRDGAERRPLLRVVTGTGPAVPGADAPARYALALRPLSAHAVRTLLAEAYGPDAAEPLVATAVAATGGLPAVLCATLRRLPAPPPDPGTFAALADQVGRHHLRSTLAGASPRAVALAGATAVAAGDFSFDQVCELAGVLPPDRTRARADLEATGLLGDAAGHPRLYDPVVAGRVIGLMDDNRRRELHERAARLALRDGLPEPVLGRLAARTRLTGHWVPGALYAAGAHARRSGDDATAVAYLERAADRGAAGGLRTGIRLELAKAQLSLRPEAADRVLRQILARATGPQRSAARLFAADLLTLRGGGDDVARLCAAAAAETGSAAERRSLLGLGELALGTGSAGPVTSPGGLRSDGLSWEGDAAGASAAAWGHCLTGRGIDRARRLATAVLTRPEDGLFAPRLVAARVLAVTEDAAPAREGLRRIEAEARRRSVGPAAGRALLELAELALRTGAPDEAAERLAEAVAEVPRQHWHPHVLPRLAALEALAALESGRPDLAESALARVPPDRQGRSLGRAFLHFAHHVLALHSGHTADETAHLDECGRILPALGCANPAVLPWRPLLTAAQTSAGRRAAARLPVRTLAALRAWGAPGPIGAAHLWAGLTGTGPTALLHLRTAAGLLAGTAHRDLHAQAVAELAAALLDAGRPAEARRLLDEAAALGRAAGARPVPRAGELRARFAGLPRASRARLSPARLRVALLAAQGRSNRAIAEELSVSLRTVELHLTHAYRALGIGGRADLAVMLGRA